MMASCLCVKCKPRYKRLVDNIFPSAQENGLVRSEMEKLTYYAVSAPEKLDRIGVYLAQKLTRDIQRKREKSVFIAMEALNQLLLACHAQQINLFVESFLKMVATLLESENYEFQALGTNSFEKFSKIEEDTPSYHRRYDFFVSKFSAMCYCNAPDKATQQKIQSHGVRGLRGVIRKTVSDELQVNIWEKQHMDKIIPSLLYSMQNNPNKILKEDGSPTSSNDVICPWTLAEESLRELLSRAAFANVPPAITPALTHMDNHKLWAPDNSFAIKCFKIVMYSIQSQYSHVAVKMLLDHLDSHLKDPESVKASMLQVLCAIVPIPASTAIGPSVIDVFNRLAKYLRSLGEGKQEEEFESAVIETTGVLARIVPEYQKVEVMTFYVNKILDTLSGHGELGEMQNTDTKFTNLLLQCLNYISSSYHANSLSSLTSSLMEPLLKVALLTDPPERFLAQKVIISLLDRNNDAKKLDGMFVKKSAESLDLISSTAGKQDSDFIDRRLPGIYRWLYDSFILDDNTADNYISLFKCVSVLCLSVMSSDVILELCRLTLAVQNTVLEWISVTSPSSKVIKNACFALAATACNFLILSYLSAVPEFQHYVDQVVNLRKVKALQFCPDVLQDGHKNMTTKIDTETLPKLTFNSNAIYSALVNRSGFNVDKLNQPFLDNLGLDNLSSDVHRSAIDVESIDIEFAHSENAATTVDGLMPANSITYEYLKQLTCNPPISRQEQIQQNRKVADHIRSVPFEQLIAEMQPDPVIEARKWVEHILSIQNYSVENEGLDTLDIPSLHSF